VEEGAAATAGCSVGATREVSWTEGRGVVVGISHPPEDPRARRHPRPPYGAPGSGETVETVEERRGHEGNPRERPAENPRAKRPGTSLLVIHYRSPGRSFKVSRGAKKLRSNSLDYQFVLGGLKQTT